MSDTENTQNQLSNIEAGQIELLTERIISNKPSDAEIIYNKRKHLGLTQKEFADKIGCSLSTIARIERGISPISANTQRKLDALDVQKQQQLLPDTVPLADGLMECSSWYMDHENEVKKKPYLQYIEEHM